ncbi:16S rRNA (cytidine(1402)-2'-O)-methyltransferase [hydrothermal vent metagenome]|uniref:16S rRNA (Cytidine(1402)-2'-O)-methyltransferase n=1 Tax=hydrothermal vent metagenome TaxID=652676 RepID=A0A3B1ACA4_9ZZZZ
MSNENEYLYIVATPIGNLGDITYRAVEILSTVKLIAAEDTRHSRKLLSHYGINTKCIAIHEHNEQKAHKELIEFIKQGNSVALISDAGTPLISDPGYILVQQAIVAGIKVIPIPGPSAVIAALSVSGLASAKFTFYGFLPAKQSARIEILQSVREQELTTIFYESPHRIIACLENMQQVFVPTRQVCLARELTKTFETIHTDEIQHLCEWVKADANQQKGEIVLLVSGHQLKNTQEISAEDIDILSLLMSELSVKKAASLTAKITGSSKNALYSQALLLKNTQKE